MTKIEDWIKEQLKKGCSKEQIKESLKKSGYAQNVINPSGFSCILNKEKEFYLRISGGVNRKVDFSIYQLMCSPECKEFKLHGGIVE